MFKVSKRFILIGVLALSLTLLVVMSSVAAGGRTTQDTGEVLARGVVISQKQGFDKCEIGTTSQMSIWWTDSPYWDSNIYIGGNSRACSNSGLNSSWISTVSSQGWNFIPTWVGPQAPCSGYYYRISWDTGAAYNEGRAEADAAHSTATSLGLVRGQRRTIVYYDMEAYDTTNSACNAAVESFISGWVGRMRELGNRGGAYGSACGSDVTGWAYIANVPDDVWIAYWNYSYYSPDATVWGIVCVSDSLWVNHQRIHQYAGGHNETYGGVTFNIDSNIADGHVAGRWVRTPGALPDEAGTGLQSGSVTAAGAGWVVRDGRLWRTAGGDWAGKTPNLPDGGTLYAAHFVDGQTGWVAAARPGGPDQGATVDILHTTDAGQTWASSQLANATPPYNPAPAALYLHFVDRQTGWLVSKLATSSNFSMGRLFRTEDGGRTWTELSIPVGEAVRFVDAQTGWTAGGPGGHELYVSRDGGQSWQRQEVAAGYYDLPTFTTTQNGVLPVTLADRVEFYTTQDQGQSWRLAASLPFTGGLAPGVKAPVSVIDGQNWVAAAPGTNNLALTSDGGQTWRTVEVGSPDASVVTIEFSSPAAGWLQTVETACRGDKAAGTFDCTNEMNVWQTADGGHTWSEIK
ncbi:MAG: glycoside hydrolase domain-containing protein [Chloroflexota bacterium]